MPLMPFLVAAGFLATILLVWGQLSVGFYTAEGMPATSFLVLAWTYLGVFVALVAFALAGWSAFRAKFEENYRVKGWPVGLLVAALVMAGIDVGQSIVSSVVKMIPEFRVGIWIAVGVIVGFIILMSWLGTKKHWAWIVEIVVLVILGAFATYAFLNGSILFIQPLPN